MKFQSRLEKFESDLWQFHIKVPKSIAKPFIEGKNKRVICRINEVLEFQCALMDDGKGDYFININKAHRKKLGLNLGQTLHLELKKDDSKYGMPLPDEFLELLQQDPEGADAFHALSIGKQRSLIYIIGKPKSGHLKLRNAIAIFEYLKSYNGTLDFKAIQQAIRDTKL